MAERARNDKGRIYELIYMTHPRDNEEVTLRMMVDKARELIEKRTNECRDVWRRKFRELQICQWENSGRRAKSNAQVTWSGDVEAVARLSKHARAVVCGPGRLLERDEDASEVSTVGTKGCFRGAEPELSTDRCPITRLPSLAESGTEVSNRWSVSWELARANTSSSILKFDDADGDLRDTTVRSETTAPSPVSNYVGTPYPKHPGKAPELAGPDARRHAESRACLMSRGSRTSAKPAEATPNRMFVTNHVLAREAGEPFLYAVIRSKERVSREEWAKGS